LFSVSDALSTSDATSIEENSAMQGIKKIDKIARQLGDDSKLLDVRHAIATLMLDQLYALQAMPLRWEKVHFTNAVAALGLNIHAIQQPTHTWLRLCLVDLRRAIESVQPHATYTACDRNLYEVTLKELIAAVEELYVQA
jgi:hypothetical protein